MKKIIAIVAVISAITACLCIGASAYENGETIQAGTVITFRDEFTGTNPATYTHLFNGIENNGNVYNEVIWDNYGLRFDPRGESPEYIYKNGRFVDNKYKTVTLTADWTIPNGSTAVALNYTVQSAALPPLKQTIDNTKATFATTLTVATAIIAWLMANQIALVGLYMYILITLVLIGKRYIKGV